MVIFLACVTPAVADYNVSYNFSPFGDLINNADENAKWMGDNSSSGAPETYTAVSGITLDIYYNGAPAPFWLIHQPASSTIALYLIATRESNRGWFNAIVDGTEMQAGAEYYPGPEVEGQLFCVYSQQIEASNQQITIQSGNDPKYPYFAFNVVMYTQSSGESLMSC
jgi:hypothetical protein